MRRVILAGALVLFWGVLLICRAIAQPPNPPATAPSTKPATQFTIDATSANAGCYVCHMTFVKETLAREHLAKGVGCIKCHGTSEKHANDEDIGATKPDIWFKRDEVNRACRVCHKNHDVAPEKVAARMVERSIGKADVVCTDCHGTHRIERAAGVGRKG